LVRLIDQVKREKRNKKGCKTSKQTRADQQTNTDMH